MNLPPFSAAGLLERIRGYARQGKPPSRGLLADLEAFLEGERGAVERARDERAYELERDRFGLLWSGPHLEVGELIKVVPASRLVAARREIEQALEIIEDLLREPELSLVARGPRLRVNALDFVRRTRHVARTKGR